MRLALLSFPLALIAMPAAAAPAVPDGTYACVLDGQALGQIRLEGGKYFGVATDGVFGEGRTFITMDPDRIEWLGDLGALTDAGYRVDKTEIREEGGRTVFDLTLLLPDQSGFVTATCAPAP